MRLGEVGITLCLLKQLSDNVGNSEHTVSASFTLGKLLGNAAISPGSVR